MKLHPRNDVQLKQKLKQISKQIQIEKSNRFKIDGEIKLISEEIFKQSTLITLIDDRLIRIPDKPKQEIYQKKS